MMENEEKIKILQDAIGYRRRDVEERQIDIDSHRVSLEIVNSKYADDPNAQIYIDYLSNLLNTAIVEQTKMKIFLEAAEINIAKYKG